MNHQDVTFVVWLVIPVLALIGAYLTLRHTRHLLDQVRRTHCVTQVRLAQAPVRLAQGTVTALNRTSIAS